MTWDGLRDRRNRSAHDDTQICRVDNLLRNQGETIEQLRADVAGLEIENAAMRARLYRQSLAHRAAAFVAIALGLAACVKLL